MRVLQHLLRNMRFSTEFQLCDPGEVTTHQIQGAPDFQYRVPPEQQATGGTIVVPRRSIDIKLSNYRRFLVETAHRTSAR